MTKAKAEAWKNRIVGHADVRPGELTAHARNFKAHPDGQRSAMGAALDEIGFLKSVTVNQRTMTIVDGHMRVALAIERGEKTVPVEFVDLTPGQEKAALAAMDPIGQMAEVDEQALGELLDEVADEAPDLAAALLDLGEEDEDGDHGPGSVPDTFEVVVTCRSRREQQKLVKQWTAAGMMCKAVTF